MYDWPQTCFWHRYLKTVDFHFPSSILESKTYNRNHKEGWVVGSLAFSLTFRSRTFRSIVNGFHRSKRPNQIKIVLWTEWNANFQISKFYFHKRNVMTFLIISKISQFNRASCRSQSFGISGFIVHGTVNACTVLLKSFFLNSLLI